MEISMVKSLWGEKEDFFLERKDTGEEYIFIHFVTPVSVLEDGKMINAPEGSCILYNKHSHQKFISKGCALVHDWCHITGSLDELTDRYGIEYNKIYWIRHGFEITSVIRHIEEEVLLGDLFFERLAELRIEELMIKIARDIHGQKSNIYINPEVKEKFMKLRAYMNTSYSETWNIKRMADFVNLSPSRFHRVYHSVFSTSPKKDLCEIRIEHAKTLLQQRRYLVQEVAEMTGYTNKYHFIRQFRESTGKSPKKWLEKPD